MKYSVLVRVINEFSIVVSAKDPDLAEEKASEAYDKLSIIKLDSKIGKFEHLAEEIEFYVEEIDE